MFTGFTVAGTKINLVATTEHSVGDVRFFQLGSGWKRCEVECVRTPPSTRRTLITVKLYDQGVLVSLDKYVEDLFALAGGPTFWVDSVGPDRSCAVQFETLALAQQEARRRAAAGAFKARVYKLEAGASSGVEVFTC